MLSPVNSSSDRFYAEHSNNNSSNGGGSLVMNSLWTRAVTHSAPKSSEAPSAAVSRRELSVSSSSSSSSTSTIAVAIQRSASLQQLSHSERSGEPVQHYQQQQQRQSSSAYLSRQFTSTFTANTSDLLEDNTEIFLVENLTRDSRAEESSSTLAVPMTKQLRTNSEAGLSSLQELLSSDLLLCKKCHRQAEKPVLLPCLDTVCSACLEVCSIEGDNRCPACQQLIGQSSGAGSQARANWFLASLCSLKLCQDEGNKQLCDYCRYEQREELASGLCIDCSDFLCDACGSAHSKTKMTRHHNVMSFDKMAADQSLDLIRQHQTFECLDHPGEKVVRFCVTCDRLICRECRDKGGDKHAKHQLFGVDEFGSKTRDSLMGMIDNVRAKVPRLAEYGQFLSEYRLSVDQARMRVSGDINEQAELLHKIVDECRDALQRQLNEAAVKEINEVSRKEEKISDIKASILSGCVFSDALVSHGRDEEVLWLHSLLKDRMSQFIFLQVEGISGKLSAVFNAGISPERSLPILFGKLNLAHLPLGSGANSSLAISPTSTQQQHYQVADAATSGPSKAGGGIFSPNVTAVVRLSSLHQQQPPIGSVTMATPLTPSLLPHGVRPLTEPAVLLSRPQLVLEFEAKSPLDTRDIWPTGIAISATTGDYFILDRDNKCVKSFDRKGRYRMEFGCPGSGDGALSSPYDLAILEERLILVTDYQHEAIKAYTMQGKYLTTYRGPFKHPRGIAAMRGRQFVVADCRMRQLTMHDADSGNLVRTVRSEGLFTDPYYVTVTHDDVIVVTDWAEPNLKLFDLEGNLIGQAGSHGNGTDQVLQPYGVTSDTSGQVMVADNSNHRIHLLGSDGRFAKFVVSKFDGLWHPMALAITPEGFLAVTEALGKVKVFKYM